MTCLVVFGPSGSGKSTLMNALVGDHGFTLVRTATTSAPRAGSERIHLDSSTFDAWVRSGTLFQATEVYRHRYAVFASSFARLRHPGQWGVLDFNYRFQALWNDYADVVKIAYLPASRDELEKYLIAAGRGDRVHEATEDYDFTLRQSRQDFSAGKPLLIVTNEVGHVHEAARQIVAYARQQAGD